MRPAALMRPALFVLLSGCYDDSLYDELLDLQDQYDTSSSGGAETAGTSASGSDDPTTGAPSDEPTGATGSATDTAGSSGSGGDGTGGAQGLDVALEVSPKILYQAGLVTLEVEHDNSAVLLELYDAIEPDTPQLTWTPDEPAPDYLITRGEQRSLTVRAYDDQGNVGVSEAAIVELQLPERGATLWEAAIELGAVAQGRAVAAGFLQGELGLVTGLDADKRAVVGRHSAFGEPSLNTSPASPVSTTSGVAILQDGWVLATGVDLVGVDSRSWLARINPFTGETQLLHQGALGETATGLAVDHELGRVYVSGYTSPKGKPSAADARIWARTIDGGELLWTRSWERPVGNPADVGKPNDQGLAVAVLDNHDPVLVGETRFFLTNPDPTLEHWAFVHRYDSSGGFEPKSKSWTSSEIFNAAGAYAVARDDDNGLLVAGWTSLDEKQSRQATILAFDELLIEAQVHDYGPAGLWHAKGVARLKTGDIVYVADVDIDDQERHDFEIRAIDTFSFEPASWTKVVTGATGARAAGLTITPEGQIVIIGTSVHPNGTTVILQGLHP